MNKNWNASIITSIICRLFGLASVLAFVYFMVALTGKLSCLWLLLLLFAVELIPTYEFKRTTPTEDKLKENKND